MNVSPKIAISAQVQCTVFSLKVRIIQTRKSRSISQSMSSTYDAKSAEIVAEIGDNPDFYQSGIY